MAGEHPKEGIRCLIAQFDEEEMLRLLTRIDESVRKQGEDLAVIKTRIEHTALEHERIVRRLDLHDVDISELKIAVSGNAGVFKGMGLGAKLALIISGAGGGAGLFALFSKAFR